MPITLATPTSDHSPRDLSTGVTDTVIDPARVRVPPLVIAHRGASADWPENTIPAFIAGIDQGADMIETDVHMSADGELVIMHDTTVDRTTDARTLYPNRQDRSIAGMNAAQIARSMPEAGKVRNSPGSVCPVSPRCSLSHTTPAPVCCSRSSTPRSIPESPRRS